MPVISPSEEKRLRSEMKQRFARDLNCKKHRCEHVIIFESNSCIVYACPKCREEAKQKGPCYEVDTH